ncbi:MAG: tetratricopeptide repeat protein, partial [Pseudorhodoplanes sp.]
RLFVDLLPDTWTALPPGLPKEVIEELARRAREAEKLLKQQRGPGARPQPAVRVRVATQPTFTRYVFELPGATSVNSEREEDNLTLVFGAPLKFDLADVKTSLPATVSAIDSDRAMTSAKVRFMLAGNPEIRAFRDDATYVVDIGTEEAGKRKADPVAAALENARSGPLGMEAPQTVPAKTPDAKDEASQAVSSDAPKPAEKPQAKTAEDGRTKTADRLLPETTPKPADRPSAQAPAPKTTAPQAPPQAASPDAPKSAGPVAEIPVAPLDDVAPRAAETAANESIVKENAKQSVAPKQSLAQEAPKAAPVADRSRAPSASAVAAALRRHGDSLKLTFRFPSLVPAAMFTRADTFWLVFDTPLAIDLAALEADTSRTFRAVSTTAVDGGQIVRLQLERPRLMSVTSEADAWSVTIGEAVNEPSRPLGIARNIIGPGRTSITVPFDAPKRAHRLTDPDVGDTLLVVTALGPPRGLLKTQDFVELRALASSHGVVVQPLADDLALELQADKVLVARPGGLILSGSAAVSKNSAAYRPVVFDAQLWGFDREAPFNERQFKLLTAAAAAPENKRRPARLELARFYLARAMYNEAKAVLDVTLADDRVTVDDPTALVLHAITNIMLGRPDLALKELADPIVGNQYDAPIWRALAFAGQGKWAEARELFKGAHAAMGTLPVELQRHVLMRALQASIEVRDFGGATDVVNELDTIGVPRELEADLSVLTGRLAQGLGRPQEALPAYRAAAESPNRPAAAQGRLRETVLRYELGDLKPSEVISELEVLTSVWRGDDTEVEALQLLARLYNQAERYRDAFHVMRTALAAHPNSAMTRRIQDEAAAIFDTLFLAGKGDALPAIEALSLFYDFRELTPIGRRGDEMIRRLADRLVAVDLLTQAAELLQHQVDNRLQGAARAQVGTRLAVVYLMNRQPDKAQATLRTTRIANLPADLRALRLMLEARALSDTGRHDVALEIIEDIDRPEAIRLRADILWVAKRYREASEQIELLHGERWKEWEPLSEPERADILRAAVGFSLSEDAIGVARLREKYAAKMADTPERRAFDAATAAAGAGPSEFREIAKAVAGLDTLEGFLRDLRARYPEIGTLAPQAAAPERAGQKLAKSDAAAPAAR